MADPSRVKVIRNPDGEFYTVWNDGTKLNRRSSIWTAHIAMIAQERREKEEREHEEARQALRDLENYLDNSLPVGPTPDTREPTKSVEILPMLPEPTLLDGLAEGEVYCFIGGAITPRHEYLAKLRTA